jgi:hypothetical protein
MQCAGGFELAPHAKMQCAGGFELAPHAKMQCAGGFERQDRARVAGVVAVGDLLARCTLTPEVLGKVVLAGLLLQVLLRPVAVNAADCMPHDSRPPDCMLMGWDGLVCPAREAG